MRTFAALLAFALVAFLSGCAAGGQVVSNASGSGSSTITAPPPPITVSINPSTASVQPNGTVSFSATVTNAKDTTLNFFVNQIPSGNSTVGTIGGGLSGGATYTAPATAPVPSTVMVTAVSVQDPSKSATALVVISNAPIAINVNVTPAAATVAPGTVTPFTAGVTGTTNTTVSWSVNGVSGGNNTVGMISPQGVYTAPLAPPSPPSVTVTATSLADPTATGSASVNIQQNVSVTVAPTVANVVTGAQLTFSAMVTGSPNTNVQWSVAGTVGGNSTVGTIGISTGAYTAPATVPTPATVAVTATSVADPTKSASAQLTITAPSQVAVSVAPATTTVAVNGVQQFMATVTGTANNTVSWSVNNIPFGNSTVGTITATGLYNAPAAVPFPSAVTVTATSAAANVSGSATVQLTSASSVNVTVAPASATIQTSSTQQFSATVTGTTITTVNWSVNGVPGGNTVIGTITNLGLYTAPAAVPTPSTVMITATSTVSPSSSGTANLMVIPPPAPVGVVVAPLSGSLKVTSQFQFNATVTGAPPGQTGVNWSVNSIPGGNTIVGSITAAGVYTAPASVPTPATVLVTATSQFQSNASGTSSITILPPDTISISPTSASVQVSLGMQFFVTITGLANTAVTYKVNGVPGGNNSVGTVGTNGLYFAPAVVPTPATVTLTATSVADPTLVATAMITIDPPVTVTINPTTAPLNQGASQQFSATVTGTSNTAVTWSVNGVGPPGNGTVGMITNTGNYTAPTGLLLTSTFTVTAASVANPAAQASALVTVNVPVGVSVAPKMATVVTGTTQSFGATVTGTTNTAVNWAVSGPANPGMISSSGVYTAPNAVPAGTVTITATSQADPTKMDTATVTVVPPVTITLSPPAVNVNTGATQLFTPTVMNTPNTAVTWTVNGAANGNASVGTINPATNVYTAPAAIPTPATVMVTATSVADPTKSASSTVTVTPVVTAISVSPPTPSIATSATQQFVAMVTGTGNLAVTWEVNGTPLGNINTVGSISPTGLYTAPSFMVVTTATMFTITARSVQNNTVTGNATVTVTPPPIVVNVSPDPVMVTVNGTQQFTAMVSNAANPAVNWTVNGQFPGNIATIGTITAGGLYTAPASPPASQPLTIQATSVQGGPTVFDTAMLTVVAAEAVTVSPSKTKVIVNQQQQFMATVTGCPSTCSISWSVVGGAVNGTITNLGLYTAPASVPSPAVVTIMATDTLHSVSGTTTTTVLPAITVSVTPTPVTLNAGGPVQTFTAMVTGTTNTAVTWFVNGVMGGSSAVGTIVQATGQYTPPAAVPNPAMVTVSAVSQADPTKSGSAMVTIQGVITVTVSPAAVGVNVNTTQQFSATVTNAANTNVTWAISGTGTIGSIGMTTGLYSAPPTVPTPATVTVTATSVQNGTSMGTATITVQPVISVAISPTAMTVTPNQPVQFTATVTGSTNTMVTWTVNGILGGNSTFGLVTTSGQYIAPAAVPSAPVVSVTATSVADPTKSASAAVTISAPSAGIFVSVFPRNRPLPIGRTQQFTAQVFLTTNPAVNWTVNCTGGVTSCGTIDPTGLYTPPAALPASQRITITAQSQADPTKSDTEPETIVAGVVVAPAADSPHVNDTLQFTATVSGVTSSGVTWAVNGIPGGNITVGTITAGGLYTTPATVPIPNQVAITATSTADPMPLPGVAAVKIYAARFLSIFPATPTVFPGGTVIFQYYTNIYAPSTKPNFGPVVNWFVNGTLGGNASVGTINLGGVYQAPLTPQTVTISCQSTINAAFVGTATVTVAPAVGTSSVALLDPYAKIRPYDSIAGLSTISLTAAHQEYADFQVLVTAKNEDLSNVDVNVSNLSDGRGNVIPSSRAIIYFEKYMNVFYSSRLQGSAIGEWPDPLIPKVDPIVGETRNAFPFSVNRISPAYKKYVQTASGDSSNTGLGGGQAQSGGTFSGSVVEMFDIVIDGGGAVGAATFKWSLDGGVTFSQTGVRTSTTPVALTDGVTVSFQAGTVAGLSDFNVGDTFWIFAGPSRNNGVWVDYYVPMATPAGTYTGTVTVTQTGKPAVNLPISLQVYTFAIPVSASFPFFVNSYWPNLPTVHYMAQNGNQATPLGQLYSVACLIDRMSCGGNTTNPNITFTATGTVSIVDFTRFDQAVGPLLDGTITPHGEQESTFSEQFLGSNPTQQFFSTQAQLAHFVAKGWRSRVFDYTKDEPSTASDELQLMARATTIRSADNTLRTLVTTHIDKYNFNTEGYVSRYVPNFDSLGEKDYIATAGGDPDQRVHYDTAVANGDEVWWYDSCVTHGCGPVRVNSNSPFEENWPNLIADTPGLLNRVWGWMSLTPYRVTGFLYFGNNFAYSGYVNMPAPQIDIFQSIHYFGGNGDGTLVYPGRPSQIGGVTHIPIESQRMKLMRDAEVDIEYGLLLQAQGHSALLQSSVGALVSDAYTYNPNPASWLSLRQTLGQNIH